MRPEPIAGVLRTRRRFQAVLISAGDVAVFKHKTRSVRRVDADFEAMHVCVADRDVAAAVDANPDPGQRVPRRAFGDGDQFAVLVGELDRDAVRDNVNHTVVIFVLDQIRANLDDAGFADLDVVAIDDHDRRISGDDGNQRSYEHDAPPPSIIIPCIEPAGDWKAASALDQTVWTSVTFF